MSAAERTKDRSNLLQHWEGRVLGLSSATSRKALSDRPALKPDWGKPTVRNFREEDGNGFYRAILLPEQPLHSIDRTLKPWVWTEFWRLAASLYVQDGTAKDRSPCH